MRLTWLPDVLRAAGLTVVEVDGWEDRGVAYTTTPLAVICHETQGSATSSVQGELGVLINGRKDLAGPIAQLMIDRKGVWYVVASGRCNQVKTGVAGPMRGKGNSYTFGVEAMHAVSEDWTRKPAQYDAYVRGVAAICARMGWKPDGHVIGHKEHQPGDKSDPEFSMPAFRAAVAGSPSAAGEDDDMYTDDDRKENHALFMATFYGGPSAGKKVDEENVVNAEIDPKTGKRGPGQEIAWTYRNGLFSQLAQIIANQKKILTAVDGGGAGGVTPEQLAELGQDITDRLVDSLPALHFVASKTPVGS